MTPVRRWRRLAIVLVAGLVISGCDQGSDVRPTMTVGQAAERTEEIVREAQAALAPGTELETDLDDTTPCDDPSDGGPPGRVFVEKHYKVVYPDGWPVNQALVVLAQYWEQRGYKVIKDLRSERNPQLAVESPNDGFRIGIEIYPRDSGRIDAFLVGSSPCIWENGTPPADT
ncbi:hypothetical protein [Plantactinospora soyae]|uniref:PASTA domain-containing protein n=1 Tax=Plantactinospora soyae TaxID=1544732 RepID=A0A927M4C3_9ACTN|nr:hypothetical protein [Plantactinospora soyae]MBE1486702.1 hypothetical protein [Plantactinospora soyae]